MSTDENEIDRELEKISAAAGDFIYTCQARSCFDGFGELLKRAEREGRAFFVIHANFFQMTQASSLLDFHTTKERAIKLISLLQKPEECFKIQPDMPEDMFDYLVYDLSSCVYENLADAAGQMEGFNSKGLHDSINGGIQICRKTGKIGCIQCFREYAGDVYLAADDLDLAKHQCQSVVDHEGQWQGRGNRRWLAMMKLGWMEVLQGNFALAQQKLENALELTDEEEVNVPIHAKFDVLIELDAVRIVRGLEPLLPHHEIFSKLPSADESPSFDLMRSQNEALQFAAVKDYDKASEILSTWDRKLHRFKARHFWFENRLRLIAVKRLAGDKAAVDSLAMTLEEKATESDDWLTLRRLNEVVGDDEEPTILAVRRNEKPFAPPQKLPVKNEAGNAEEPDDAISPFGDEQPVLLEKLDLLLGRIREAYVKQSNDALLEVLNELITITPEDASTNADTCGVLNMMSMLITSDVVGRIDEVWRWANSLAAQYKENGVVLSLLATVGNELRMVSDDPEEGPITPARIEQLFKKSLELEKNGPHTYARAGSFFLDRGDVGEAEKCYARGFKLDRKNGGIAMKLADVYTRTDRPRDAMHVLDLCLREGTDLEFVAWEAAMIAFLLKQFEPMLNYLNRFEGLDGELSPIEYYRAIAYLHLGRFEESLSSIRLEKESLEGESNDLHCQMVEFCALAAIELDSADDTFMQNGESIENPLERAQNEGSTPIHKQDDDDADAIPLADKTAPKKTLSDETLSVAAAPIHAALSEFEAIPMRDIRFLHELLWATLNDYDPTCELLEPLEFKMLAGAIMHDEYFDKLRSNEEIQDGIQFYRVLVEQPLNSDWQASPGCFSGQENWDNYLCEWGVLATNKEDAISRVIEVQAICFSGPLPEVADVYVEDQVFTDAPGVVWQGVRYCLPEGFDYTGDDVQPLEDGGFEGFDEQFGEDDSDGYDFLNDVEDAFDEDFDDESDEGDTDDDDGDVSF